MAVLPGELGTTLKDRALFLAECLLSMLLDSAFFIVWALLTYLDEAIESILPAARGDLAKFSSHTIHIIFAASLLVPLAIFLLADLIKLWKKVIK